MVVRLEHAGGAAATALSGSLAAGALSFTVVSGTSWPTGATGPFVVTIDRGTASEERIKCDSRSGTTVTINASGRGFDGTTDTLHANAAVVEHTFSATEADEANVAAVAVALATGGVVGVTSTNTLTNKTLTSPVLNTPTINSPVISSPSIGATQWTNSTHTHAGASTGGNIPESSVTNLVADLALKAPLASPTLVTPTIASFVNAVHDHSNAAGGGNVPQASITGLVAALAAITTPGAWTAFTLTTAGSSGITLGNATQDCAYRLRDNKTAQFRIELTLGTTSSISATVALGPLPFSGIGTVFQTVSAQWIKSAGTQRAGTSLVQGTTISRTVLAADGYWNATAPAAFATGDVVRICGTVELA